MPENVVSTVCLLGYCLSAGLALSQVLCWQAEGHFYSPSPDSGIDTLYQSVPSAGTGWRAGQSGLQTKQRPSTWTGLRSHTPVQRK